VSRETLRKWMAKASLWRPRSQRVKTIHVWRERRASFGEMVMQDSSPFRWLEERGPACQLIAVIDDATSRLWGRFTEHDTTEENLRTFGGWLERYGRPLAHYTDKTASSVWRGRRRFQNSCAEKSTLTVRTSATRTGDRMDRGAQSAGERTDRATVRNFAGPLGEGNALDGDRQHRSRESLFGDALSSGMGTAL